MDKFNIKEIQFNQILNNIQKHLSKIVGSSVMINKSTIFGQFLTSVAAVAHNIMLYIEDAFVEQNKYTTQRKKSIVGLAALSGYKPSMGTAAAAWVRMSYNTGASSTLPIIVQNHEHLICTQNGLDYSVILEDSSAFVVKPSDVMTKYVKLIQGTFETQRFVGTGDSLEAHSLKVTRNMDEEYIEVTVNGMDYEKVESLYDMRSNNKQFFIRNNIVGGVDVVFGNGKYGRKITNGDNIVVKYLVHDGNYGNIDTTSTVKFTFANQLHDINGGTVNGNSILNVSLVSKDSISTGADSESMDQVREMIGFSSRSLVLATPENFKAFLSKYSFVGYNRTWAENNTLVINSLIMKDYSQYMSSGSDYFGLKESDFKLSDLQKASIKNSLIDSGRLIAGCTYNILDMELMKYSLILYIRLKSSNTDRSIVSASVKQIVGQFFGNVQSDQYIPKSDIINTIKDSISEVDGVNCYILSKENEDAMKNRKYTKTEYSYNTITQSYDKSETEVSLYYITNDDGTVAIENPMIGLDAHGNISIESDRQFPVLMGGWTWVNKQGQEVTAEAITIVYEN